MFVLILNLPFLTPLSCKIWFMVFTAVNFTLFCFSFNSSFDPHPLLPPAVWCCVVVVVLGGGRVIPGPFLHCSWPAPFSSSVTSDLWLTWSHPVSPPTPCILSVWLVAPVVTRCCSAPSWPASTHHTLCLHNSQSWRPAPLAATTTVTRHQPGPALLAPPSALAPITVPACGQRKWRRRRQR